MTPVLVLRCQRMLSSLHFLPPSGAVGNAVVLIIWISSVTARSYGAEGGRGALSGLPAVLNKADIPAFSIETLAGLKAPVFAFCCASF